ncbi:MAG: hydrogenase maturation protease [Halobacterium sp.]
MTDEAVVGVGNPTMRDDGVGHRVVDALEGSSGLPDGVALHRTATNAFLALEALDGADRGIVVDAVDADDADPGTVHRYRFRDGCFEGGPPDVLMHDLSFADALTAGRRAYDLPDDVVVLGVQPGRLDAGVGLSDPVADAVPAVVDAVLAELDATAAGVAAQSDEHPANSRP